jgi:hypothetical protein
MGYIKLHEKDAAKFGCPERVDFEFESIGVRQRAAVEKACRRSIRWMLEQIQGVPEFDENNNPIPIPVVDDDGNQVMEDDGVTPKMTPKLRRDPEATAMLVYLALWGAGYRLDWDTFDVRAVGLEVNFTDDEDEANEGKDKPVPEASATTESSMQIA